MIVILKPLDFLLSTFLDQSLVRRTAQTTVKTQTPSYAFGFLNLVLLAYGKIF